MKMNKKVSIFLIIVLLALFIFGLSYLVYAKDCCSPEEKYRCPKAPDEYYLAQYSCTCAGGELTSRDCVYYPEI